MVRRGLEWDREGTLRISSQLKVGSIDGGGVFWTSDEETSMVSVLPRSMILVFCVISWVGNLVVVWSLWE